MSTGEEARKLENVVDDLSSALGRLKDSQDAYYRLLHLCRERLESVASVAGGLPSVCV